MGKFDQAIEIYKNKGVKHDNIEYAISSIKDGTKREFILEGLTADYRGMQYIEADQMLNDFYKAYGGEFKKESRVGYLIGSLALCVGLLRVFFRIGDKSVDEILKDPWDIAITAGISILVPFYFCIKAFRGTFREKDNPIK